MRPRFLHLLFLAVGFALVVRIGDLWQGVGAALQIGPAQAAEAPPAESMPAADHAAGGNEASPVAASEPAGLTTDLFNLTDEEIELLQRLGERRAEIEQRLGELDQRSALLQAAEQRIDEKIEELKTLREAIEALLLQHGEQEEAQLKSLVKIYESMKPKDAARIFEELDMVVLLEVIQRMKERKTAPILAQLNPARAKEITLELAKRRELPKKAAKP